MDNFKDKLYHFNCHEIIWILNYLDEHKNISNNEFSYSLGALFVHLKQLGYPVHTWQEHRLEVENDWLGKLMGEPTRKETFIEYILRLANEVRNLYVAND